MIHKDPANLNTCLNIAVYVSVQESDANNYKAFWVNTYNITVIKGIIVNYPIKCLSYNIDFFDKTTYILGGKIIAFNDIENKLLRAKFKDAYFNFVVFFGAIGCPALIS